MKYSILFLIFFSGTLPVPEISLKSSNNTQFIDHAYYFELYSESYRQSECSYYKLTPSMTECHAERENTFKIDQKVNGVKVKASDYSKTGYDKGHLTPANHFCYNQEAMNSTFLMSNISPQLPNFNRGIWKELEYLTKLWVKNKGECWIFSGPIFENKNHFLSKDSILIPTHFYKIVYCKLNQKIESISFIIPHKEYSKDVKLQDFVSTIDDIEQKTKIDFFNNLEKDKQTKIESIKLNGTWLFY